MSINTSAFNYSNGFKLCDARFKSKELPGEEAPSRATTAGHYSPGKEPSNQATNPLLERESSQSGVE